MNSSHLPPGTSVACKVLKLRNLCPDVTLRTFVTFREVTKAIRMPSFISMNFLLLDREQLVLYMITNTEITNTARPGTQGIPRKGNNPPPAPAVFWSYCDLHSCTHIGSVSTTELPQVHADSHIQPQKTSCSGCLRSSSIYKTDISGHILTWILTSVTGSSIQLLPREGMDLEGMAQFLTKV